MPIYAYRCEACGFAKDVLQSMSAAPLTDCESCGKPEFRKQVTAAGFQLKGSGWYVTDFRNGSAPAANTNANAGASTSTAATTAPETTSAPAAPAASAATPAPAAASSTATPAPAAS